MKRAKKIEILLNNSVGDFVPPGVMKKLLMLAALSAVSLAAANADWRESDGYYPTRHGVDVSVGFGGYGDRGGYRGGYRDHEDCGRYERRRPMSLEARAQLRLRQSGYYYGPIDGDFGYGSRRALYRFQRDRHLPMTGYLDWRTRRALGI